MFFSKRDQIVADLVSWTKNFFYYIPSGFYCIYLVNYLAICVKLFSICYDTFNVFNSYHALTFFFIVTAVGNLGHTIHVSSAANAIIKAAKFAT